MPFTEQQIQELREYFQAKTVILDSLPDIRTMPEFSIVYIRQSDGTKLKYVSENGEWRAEYSNANQVYI